MATKGSDRSIFGSLTKVGPFFVLCAMLYVYIYSSISVSPVQIHQILNDTVENWEKLKSANTYAFLNITRNKMKFQIHAAIVQTINDTLTNIQEWKNDSNFSLINIIKNQTYRTLNAVKEPFLNINKTLDSETDSRNLTRMNLTSVYNLFKDSISKNKTSPLVTLFTTWSVTKEKYVCHNNTVENWVSLKPFVQLVLFTNDIVLSANVQQKGWNTLPVRRTTKGIPILKHMCLDVKRTFNSEFYAFVNGDILFTKSLIMTLLSVLRTYHTNLKPLLVIGKRVNVLNVNKTEASSWKNIENVAKQKGKLFTGLAEDFFITTPSFPWGDIPEVVIGRRAYDNWLVLYARNRGFLTIDATKTLLALHQTTKIGNYEGFTKPNKDINTKLLQKLHKKINYRAGKVECAQYYTRWNNDGEIYITERNKTKGC